ncbi:hypothetical protein F5Y18DRAFT_371438 [Xylariaceae sp. FL1019]|nr:hypothetical protein F5Y18DRAFT_371438 [Xylariaceae sp. FL1019]
MSPRIPAIYRHLFTTIEPLLATIGAVQALFFPTLLLSSTLPSIPYTRTLSPFFIQMTGSWLMLAYHDFYVLRREPSIHAWRQTLTASAISDVFYTTSLVQSMGPAWFFNPLRWNVVNACTVITTVGPFIAKLLFLAGVGFPKDDTTKKTS